MSNVTNNKISINAIIGNVCGNLGIRNINNVIDDFARWAVDAELKIGSEGAYKRFECEIDVKDRRACLPENFITLIALKKGNQILDLSLQDFKIFSKGATKGVSESKNNKYVSGNLQPSDPGVPNVLSVEYLGSYVAGETVNLTVSANRNGTVSVNTFIYLVQVGDTLADIATQMANQFMAVANLGYSVIASGSILNITGNDNYISLSITPFTDSILGSIKVLTLQHRRLPSQTATTTSGTFNGTINKESPNLANLTAANLNTGNQSQHTNSINMFGQSQAGYSVNSNKFSIENGYLYFNVMDNEKLGIAYWGIDLDENGWPLINVHHEDAVTHYLMYMYKARDFYNGKVSGQAYQALQSRWFWLCGQARGDDEMPDESELRQLSNMWNQVLPLPNKNFF